MKTADIFRRESGELKEKVCETLRSVLPIVLIVALMCFTIVPMPTDLLLSFLVGCIMIILGMGLFTLGAQTSMTPIGNRIGSALTATRNLPLILVVSFFLGFAVTIAEPDLQVLAQTAPHIDTGVLLITMGVGVGFFLAVCMLRIIMGLSFRKLLIFFYAIVFVLAAFTDKEFLGVAFDSGGVTTGPMTVPFILALGVGVSNIRSDSRAEADSFGLVALSSIGPILSVLVLGFFYKSQGVVISRDMQSWANTAQIGRSYLAAIPHYMAEIALSLSPIVVIFLLFQAIALHLPRRNFLTMCLGIMHTYVGLVLFLTGVNVGFSSLGLVLGESMAAGWTKYLMIPLSMMLGWLIIGAEPAVYVLEKQIDEISAGAIPRGAVKLSLSAAIAVSMGLSMLRVFTGISLMWFLVPGYAAALLLSFVTPDMYTAMAFDSGGVASGPMTATFMLQFVMGASAALGGNILEDAFGLVALVAMTPLISIQVMGCVYMRRQKKEEPTPASYGDEDIIELWEVG